MSSLQQRHFHEHNSNVTSPHPGALCCVNVPGLRAPWGKARARCHRAPGVHVFASHTNIGKYTRSQYTFCRGIVLLPACQRAVNLPLLSEGQSLHSAHLLRSTVKAPYSKHNKSLQPAGQRGSMADDDMNFDFEETLQQEPERVRRRGYVSHAAWVILTAWSSAVCGGSA